MGASNQGLILQSEGYSSLETKGTVNREHRKCRRPVEADPCLLVQESKSLGKGLKKHRNVMGTKKVRTKRKQPKNEQKSSEFYTQDTKSEKKTKTCTRIGGQQLNNSKIDLVGMKYIVETQYGFSPTIHITRQKKHYIWDPILTTL